MMLMHKEDEDKTLKIRNVLNIIFMIVALIGVLYYLFADHQIGIYIILFSMIVKFAESTIRLLN